MIRIHHLMKRFQSVVAVDDLTLEIPAGEIFGFLGPNGAGKTTTVKMLTGLLRPTSGEVRIGDFDVQKNSLEAKRLIGYVPDQPFVYPLLTGKEFLRFVGDLYGVSWKYQENRIPDLLKMFELWEWGDELVETYSHGMRQKLVLASVLLHQPKVLLLDEPLVGLDPKSARLVKEIFRRLSEQGISIFMCTHVLEIAEKLCHRVGIILQGKLLTLGSPNELRRLARTEGSLEEAFLTLTGGTEFSEILKVL